MTGKDYCNCEHAQMLLYAIEEAQMLLGMFIYGEE